MALCRRRVPAAPDTLRPGLTAWTIGRDRGVYGSWLSVRPGPPAPPWRGGCFGGFWPEQAHADQPPMVIDTLNRVSAQLELGHDCALESEHPKMGHLVVAVARRGRGLLEAKRAGR